MKNSILRITAALLIATVLSFVTGKSKGLGTSTEASQAKEKIISLNVKNSDKEVKKN